MSIRRQLQSLVIALAFLASVIFASPASAQASGVENPDLSVTCGDAIEIALVLDASGSVAGFDAVDDVRNIGLDITNSLVNRNVSLSVVEYASFADTPIASTPLTSATAASIFRPYFDGSGSPAYYDGRVDRFTNWEDGFQEVFISGVTPDLVIFVSDGTPNTTGNQATHVNGNADIVDGAAAAAVIADSLKTAGSHILAVGVAGLNDGAGTALMQSVSGSDNLEDVGLVEGDLFIGEFIDLGPLIESFTRDLCGGSATITSLIDADGDLSTTNDQSPAVGWPINIDRASGDFSVTGDVTSDAGTVLLTPDWDANGDDNFEFWLGQPPVEGFFVASSTCQRIGEPGRFDAGFRVRNLEMERFDLVECTFVNAALPFSLGFDLQTTSVEDVDASGNNSVGDMVHYEAIARNEGGGILTDVTITSELVEWTACSPELGSSLRKGEEIVCVGQHVITGDEPGARIVHDATANSTETGELDDQEVTALPEASLEIDKDVIRIDDNDFSDDPSVGDVIHYRVEATNIDSIILTGVVVTDPSIANLSCTPIGALTLHPGQSVVCSGSRTITAEDLATTIPNTAAATSDQTGEIEEGEAVPVPALALRFDTEIVDEFEDLDGNGAPSRGDIITIVNIANNIGGSNLTDFAIVDTLSDPLVCDSGLRRFAPGQIRECTSTHVITVEEQGTTLVNNAAATSTQTGDVPDSDTFVVPSAELTVTAEVDELIDRDASEDPSPGDVVVFRFVAQNTGEMTLTEVDFVPADVENLVCNPITDRLEVGEFIECRGERPITGDDLGTTISAPATATSFQAREASATATAEIGIPRAEIDKTIVRTDDIDGNDRLTVGDVVRYEIAIRNTGTANLSGLVLEDSLVTPDCGIWTDGHLRAGETVVCEAAITLTEVHAGSTIVNTASISSNQLDEIEGSATLDVPLAAVCRNDAILFDDSVVLLGFSDTTSIASASITSGLYEVRVVGADAGHEAGFQTHQTQEQFIIEFLDASGRVIAVSDASDDLTNAALWSRSSLDDVELGRSVSAVRARHIGTADANSITAICVELERTAAASVAFADEGDIVCSDSSIMLNELLLGTAGTSVAGDVAAGAYIVSLISEDLTHDVVAAPSQADERWKLQFIDESGDLITETLYTADLADAAIRRIDQVGESVTLDRPATSLRLVGAGDSITAVCAELRAL